MVKLQLTLSVFEGTVRHHFFLLFFIILSFWLSDQEVEDSFVPPAELAVPENMEIVSSKLTAVSFRYNEVYGNIFFLTEITGLTANLLLLYNKLSRQACKLDWELTGSSHNNM